MPRPKSPRHISFKPKITYFKPQGIRLRDLKETQLNSDQFEALRLKYVEKLDQTTSAKKMNISQSTFQRILSEANEQLACALVNGKAIRIEKPSE